MSAAAADGGGGGGSDIFMHVSWWYGKNSPGALMLG